jgi:outer membrane protein assembly factor BamB/tetratricopeptide (TPR) repeat protein
MRSCCRIVMMLLCLVPVAAQAQLPGRFPADDRFEQPAEEHHLRRMPRDPLSRTSYYKGLEAIENEDVSLGLETLQSLLDETVDFFMVEQRLLDGLAEVEERAPSSLSLSLLDRVEQVLRGHREEYERLYGPTARQQLEEARQDQDIFALEEVVRRFGMTDAGAEALRELARYESDRGHPDVAARHLRKLSHHPAAKDRSRIGRQAVLLFIAAGMPAQAQAMIDREGATEDLKNLFAEALLTEEGQPALPPPPSDAPLRDWRIPFGGTDHAGQAAYAPAIFDDAWKAPLFHAEFDFFLPIDRDEQQLVEQLAEEAEELAATIDRRVRSDSDRVAFPAGRPLVVGDQVVVMGHGSLKSYDLRTGRLRWNGVEIDPTFAYLNKQSYSPSTGDDAVREEMRQLFFTVRGWRDLTSASLSTDGRRVYAISNCQLVGTTAPQALIQNSVQHPLLAQRSNLLTAYDLNADGKKLWSIGTPDVGSRMLMPFDGDDVRSEIFFYGAPLPVDDRLYVIGEERGQIQLFEIDPQTGSILWSLGLLNPDEDLVLDENRRLSGLMPSYGGGILICPTGEGVLTAVDPLRRKVVWSHQYGAPMPIQLRRNQILRRRGLRAQSETVRESMHELLQDRRWFDSRVIVAGGHVVFTPPDEHQLVCLNLEDGTPAWSKEVSRLQMLSAATVYGEHLVLVGPSDISAIRLEDGQPAWSEAIPIPKPSGRGVRMGRQFFQPLTTGEIAVVDLEQGRLLCRSPLTSGGTSGNLVAAGGWLVSQTATEVVAFRSLSEIKSQIARQLAKDEQDPLALSLQGEVALQQGRLPEGLASLRQSVRRQPDPRSKRVLSWALLDSLRHDFDAFESESKEIESLLQDDEQELQFLRTYAHGLHQSGRYQEALLRYLKILEVLPEDQPLRDQDSRWGTTDGQWVVAQIQELFEAADAPMRAELHRAIGEWMDDLADESLLLRFLKVSPDAWMQVTAATPANADAEQTAASSSLQRQILDRLKRIEITRGNAHDQELILLTLLDSDEEQVRREALARLAHLSLEMKQGASADRLLAELELQAAPAGTPEDEAAKTLADALRNEERYSETLSGVTHWPPHVQQSDRAVSFSRTPRFQIPTLGPVSPQLEGWNFFLDQMGTNISIFDADGQHHGKVPTELAGARYPMGNYLGRHVVTHGHRAVVVLTDRFILLDFLSDPDQGRVVLNRKLVAEESDSYSRGFVIPGPRPRPGMRTFVVKTDSSTYAGNVGPLTATHLCYGIGENLIALDPATGKELWKRRDLVQGSEIFGDERFVLVKPPEEDLIHVYRAADGKELFSREMPAGTLPSCLARRIADWGRLLPVVERSVDLFTWKMYDPVTDEIAWTWSGPEGTVWAPVSGQDVAFLSPATEPPKDGQPPLRKLAVRHGLTGRELLQTSVPIETSAKGFTMQRFADQWVLTTNPLPAGQAGMFGSHIQNLVYEPADGSVVAVERRTGQVQWRQPVSDQMVITQYPSRWPVLVFGNAEGRTMNALVLNRTTGEEVFQDATLNDGTGIGWQGQTQPTRIQLRFARQSVELECLAPLNGRDGDADDSRQSPPAPPQSEPSQPEPPPPEPSQPKPPRQPPETPDDG